MQCEFVWTVNFLHFVPSERFCLNQDPPPFHFIGQACPPHASAGGFGGILLIKGIYSLQPLK
jgi:hypothetical protein